jgi:hypothetical protein
MRKMAVARMCEAEWRSSSRGVIDMACMVCAVLPTIAGPKGMKVDYFLTGSSE